MEVYYNEDKTAYAVLVSHGSGWSSWNDRTVAYDKRMVEFWLTHHESEDVMRALSEWEDNDVKAAAEQYFASIGYPHIYFSGFADITLEWVPVGSIWCINEYDGSETLMMLNDYDWQHPA